MQIADDGIGIVTEADQRDTDDGAGPAPATHAVHGDADAAPNVVDDVGRGSVDDGAFAFRDQEVARRSRDPAAGTRSPVHGDAS